MDENNNLAPEEAKLEQEALAEKKADEIRAQVITEYGFDEVTDADRIEKLVTKEMESRKKLSDAIGQKIKWRTEASKPKEAPKDPASTFNPADLVKTLDQKLIEKLEERDLEAMDYPAEIKSEIQRIAKITGVSIKQAAKDPYIVSKIEALQGEDKVEEAAISKKNRSGGKKEVSLDNPPDVDMTTEEGQKAYDEWKQKLIAKGY